MTVPSDAIIELQELYSQTYGQEIDREQAQKLADSLLSLMKSVYIDSSPDKRITRTTVTH